ncbi:MAG: phage portal protein [Casimicrobiaceae bacterium]
MPPRVKVNTKKKRSPARVKENLTRNELVQYVKQNAELLSRSMLGNRLGVSFNGERDLYESFGYPRNPNFQDYQNLYERGGLAQRIIKKHCDSTWNKVPVLIDGQARSDSLDAEATDFLKAWDALQKKLGIIQVMRQADIMCNIGRYSVLFLGTSGKSYSERAKKGGGLFYLSAYNEIQASITSLIQDVKNEMYGMPQTYAITFNNDDIGLENPGGSSVHYTRAIHIAEDKLGSRLYGTPRLKAPLNRLLDLEKTTGGGAEAAWLAVWGGMLFTTQENARIPDAGSAEGQQIDEQMRKFYNRMQRYAMLEGVDVNNIGVQNVSVKDIYDTLKTDLAGTVGIPQRILFGAERGELASSQDQQEWNGAIDSRRTNYAEPEILRPFIKWCVDFGVLPMPQAGLDKYIIEWYPVYSMSQMEQATYGNAMATGASTISGGAPEQAMDVNEWRSKVGLPPRTEEDFDDILDLEIEEDKKKLEVQKEQFKVTGGADKKETPFGKNGNKSKSKTNA